MRKYIKGIVSNIVVLCPKVLLNIFWDLFDSNERKLAVIFREAYLKKYAKSTGKYIFIGKNVNLKNINNLTIGSYVSIHSNTYIDAYGEIEIGDNVSIANQSTLISSDHTWQDLSKPIKFNDILKKPIIIHDDVWIASGCRILGNVTIESRSIIGAGAVVNKNVDYGSLCVGVPAQKIKTIKERVNI